MKNWKHEGMRQGNPDHIGGKLQKNISKLKELLSPEDSLLDVGCYRDHLYDVLEHKNYMGVDLFESNIKVARELHPDANFEVKDLFELEGKWDVIWCSRVLMHIPDFEMALNRLRSCVRKHLLICIPIAPEGRIDVDETAQPEGPVYFRVFSQDEILKTGGEIFPGGIYSTVVYGPLLP